jgi:hypothetical protein
MALVDILMALPNSFMALPKPFVAIPTPLEMPPQCSSLGSISRNRQLNCELTSYTRGKIVGLSLKGAKPTEIQDLLKITCGALRSTLSLDQLRDEGVSQL